MDQGDQLKVFFKHAYGPSVQGYMCIALYEIVPGGEKKWTEHFFRYPDDLDRVVAAISEWQLTNNVYFCAQLLDKKRRIKDNVGLCPTAWADLDSCEPERLLVEPSILIESSPGRWQALWKFAEPQPSYVAEDVSKRIAYYHGPDGADRSGWDLTQMLRVPGTPNHKYSGKPAVRLADANRGLYLLEDFESYPELKHAEFLKVPMPKPEDLPESSEAIFEKHRATLIPTAITIANTEPDGTWSEALWRLEMMLFECGLSREEVFVVARESKCNKYARDGKDETFLWIEVCRASVKHQENTNQVFFQGATIGPLLTEEEEREAAEQEGFVERYIEWASGLGDAATQYHQAGAFTILSALLSGRVNLPTSYGTVVPNLWFMILGDTTLTRKSTAMDLAIDLVMEVDQDVVLATDGSVEGLMQQLEARPKRPSIFLRDEFSGLLEMITKRDYYAGMAEVLTKLYDGKMQKRVLRKETVTVRDPILLILAGGIRNRVQSLLTHEHVSSGFIPRFVFITAESDTSRIKPLGPPTARDVGNKDVLVREMEDLITFYGEAKKIRIKALGESVSQNQAFHAELSPGAWARYNKLEADLVECGLHSEKPDLMTPLFDRLAKSGLKAAVLLAAARQREESVVVEEVDILHAIRYVEQWRAYAIEVVNGIGKTVFERDLDKILQAVIRRPGIGRAQLMQSYHLTAQAANQVFDTLQQRGQVTMIRTDGTGRQTYYPTISQGGTK
jgi:hypothetical protein